MTGHDLLLFLLSLRNSELQKQIKLEVGPMDSRPLLDIDDMDPDFIHLQAYVPPFSEN